MSAMQTLLEVFVEAPLIDVRIDRRPNCLGDGLFVGASNELQGGGPLIIQSQCHCLSHIYIYKPNFIFVKQL